MPFFRDLFRQNSSTLLSLFLLVVLPLLGSSSITYFLYEHQELLRHLSAGQLVLYFGLMTVALAFSLMHSTVAVLLTGFFLGWPGLPGTIAAYAFAALLGYQLATTLDRGKLLAFLQRFPRADAVMHELRQQSWQLILLTRLAPVLPFALMTFLLALMRVPRGRFLSASIVGMLPRSLFFYWIGTQASDALALVRHPDTGTAGKALLIGLLGVAGFGLYYVFNKALKRALAQKTSEEEKNQI